MEGGTKRTARQTLEEHRYMIALVAAVLVFSATAFWAVFLGTNKTGTLSEPGGGLAPVAYANPTWTAVDYSAFSTGATVANWSIHVIREGPLRTLRIVAYALILSNDFIYFPLGTFGAADLPAMDLYVPEYYYQTGTASCLLAPTVVAQCTFLVFSGGDALIGIQVLGADGPFVDMYIFPSSAIGTYIFGLSSAITWTSTFSGGPPVNVNIAAASPNNTQPITAAAFGARWQSIHGITPAPYPTPIPTPLPFNNQTSKKK